ncbi:TPA: response regulator [Streptococcus pyogenes]|uniref:Putative response regulator of salavaricin regulon n=1 Tax=Streptococcus pyogenes serotype M3 (strain ATCC BAA-595 / MGAS315) TaxID=198466 RepID=A0A0H2UWE1_STRP3|nr:response regulator transcription factor [Streptococcus pyogenes]HER4599564.1 response regulator transcription factor [Streptococcus pyogenes NGAS606]HER4727347.1 response regulator transcription factor [Streptococcus pyogenes NGAS312]AAM80252.1 putative response regulator of salavaricin regulon [Streptococcus pyogenes MGAS315]VGS75769.1 transcriptional regulatory protein degU [Streptococcus pyogenes]HEP6034204.1 response regulator transcription factor [Streptococcus pyogenes]
MKILLIDDHRLFAKSIQLLFQQYDEVDVIDTITSHFNDVTIDLSKYDIILLDINLTNISKENGLEIAKELIQSTLHLKVVMLTGYVKSIYRERAKKVGAYGFVDKNIDPKQLISILKKVDSGKKYFEQIESQDYVESLTDQEIAILNLSKKGFSIKEIEETLQISRRTVFNHLTHIYSKLLVNNKQEAIYKAEQLGYFMDF